MHGWTPYTFHWTSNVMILIKRAVTCLTLLLVIAGRPAFAQQPAAPEQQGEFLPIDQLPPQDQLPAAPLLIAAYAVVLVGFFGYVLSVARRLGTVQREIERLEADIRRTRKV